MDLVSKPISKPSQPAHSGLLYGVTTDLQVPECSFFVCTRSQPTYRPINTSKFTKLGVHILTIRVTYIEDRVTTFRICTHFYPGTHLILTELVGLISLEI